MTSASTHADLLALMDDMRSRMDAGMMDAAYQSLMHAAQICPETDTDNRDKIAKFLLNFALLYAEDKNFENALSAVNASRDLSPAFETITSRAIEFFEDCSKTEETIAELDSLLQSKTSDGDPDSVAKIESDIACQQLLYRNRTNPLHRMFPGFLDYPQFIHLETLAVCNAACSFCPYPDIERQGTRMPDQLIEKIIDDLTEIPPHMPLTIAPYKVSDPFIEKRLFSIIALINEKLPSAKITLITNGSTMTKKALQRVAALKNIKYLRVSLNDYRQAEYEQLMGIPFDKTLKQLDVLHDMVNANEFPHPVTIGRVREANRHDKHFLEYCQERYPAIPAFLYARNDWIGNVEERTSSPTAPDVGCNRWYHLSIVATGNVALCCMDGHDQWTIGDANNQNVLEIYNSKRYRDLREFNVSRLTTASPCNTCTYV